MDDSILRESLRWHRAGWSLIPMKLSEKKPAQRWKRYQRECASESTIRRWFRDAGFGLAVIFGSVSGNLASMDFDELNAFHQWEQEHPELAQTLPIVETRRGRHVYFQADSDDLRHTREALGKDLNGTGAIHLPGGELRAGVGCYSVIPPSIHPSGFQYQWIREPVLPLPVVSASVFIPAECYRDYGGLPRLPKSSSCDGKRKQLGTTNVSELVQLAIERTLSSKIGERDDRLFIFAREVRAIPGLADAPFSELKPIVREWHTQALPNIGTKPFDTTWSEFGDKYHKVKFPIGEDSLQMIVEQALNSQLPEIARDYDSAPVQALIAICCELQRASGDSPFFLSARTAGRLLEISHMHASRYLRMLCRDEVLKEIQKGSQASKKASRYRYLHEL